MDVFKKINIDFDYQKLRKDVVDTFQSIKKSAIGTMYEDISGRNQCLTISTENSDEWFDGIAGKSMMTNSREGNPLTAVQDDSNVIMHAYKSGKEDLWGGPEVSVFKNAGDAVFTEKLNREGRDKVNKAWKDRTKSSFRYGKANDYERRQMLSDTKFNNFAGEYYGNQYHILKGDTKPDIEDRSGFVQDYQSGMNNSQEYNPNVDPNDPRYKHRVTEGYSRLDEDELQEKADFRYVRDGELIVGDYETSAYWESDQGNQLIKMNLFKNHGLTSNQVNELMPLIDNVAIERANLGQSLDIGEIINEAMNRTQVITSPSGDTYSNPERMQMVNNYRDATQKGNVRPGKILNDADSIGDQIYPQEQRAGNLGRSKSQDRMEEITYGYYPIPRGYNGSPTKVADINSNDPRAMIPQEIISIDTRKAREHIGMQVAKRASRDLNGKPHRPTKAGTLETTYKGEPARAPYVLERKNDMQGILPGLDNDLYRQLLSRQ